MHSVRSLLALCLLAIAVGSCGRHAYSPAVLTNRGTRRADAPGNDRESLESTQQAIWRIADTVVLAPPDVGYEPMVGYRIAVARGQTWDTLSDVVTLFPHVLSDSVLVLRALSPDQRVRLILYNRYGRNRTVVEPPSDADPASFIPEFSPAGHLVAYEVPEPRPAGGSRLVVRRWGDWRLIIRTQVIEGCNDAGMLFDWSQDGRYLRWRPPPCRPEIPEVDSLQVLPRE